MHTRLKLTGMYVLQFGIWGCYLTSQGRYLSQCGLAGRIGYFYSAQGLVALFMPALVGYIADRFMHAQKLLVLCHALSAIAMAGAGCYGCLAGPEVSFPVLLSLYFVALLCYFPTLSLSNAVTFSILEKSGLNPTQAFPSIRIWGTAGFILAMWAVDLAGWQSSAMQYILSGGLGLIQAAYILCFIRSSAQPSRSRPFSREALGLFRQRETRLFFLFSLLLGMASQVSSGYANTFLADFGRLPAYAGSFGVRHANIFLSLSQISEMGCVLLVPWCFRRFGIKTVFLTALAAWALRFAFFAAGNPGGGCWLLLLSMGIYGIAFNFFSIAGSLYVNSQAADSIRASAQGMFTFFSNGLGATTGTLIAQHVMNRLVFAHQAVSPVDWQRVMTGWQTAWLLFAGYILLIFILFYIFFPRRKHPAS